MATQTCDVLVHSLTTFFVISSATSTWNAVQYIDQWPVQKKHIIIMIDYFVFVIL